MALGFGTFSRAAQEDGGNDGEVADGVGIVSVGLSFHGCDECGKDGDVDRPYTRWFRVFVFPSFEDSSEAVMVLFAVCLEAGIDETQSGEPRAHGT